MNTGELVTLTLAGTDNSATLAPFRGALATSLRIRGRELLYLDESTLHDSTRNVRGGIPVLFPTPGKLEADRWRRDGREGVMKQHGFARNSLWSLVTRDSASATLALQSDDSTFAQYPWTFEAQLAFELRASSFSVAISVRNTGAEAMPFAFGFHPYFLVGDKSHAAVRSRATRAYDNVSRMTGAYAGINLQAVEVDLHLIDHPDDHLDLDLGDGDRVVVRTAADFRRWVVWTLSDKPFVCVEPWTAPGNALNTGEGLTVLPPGREYASWIQIELA